MPSIDVSCAHAADARSICDSYLYLSRCRAGQ